jgi:hypothetical protein
MTDTLFAFGVVLLTTLALLAVTLIAAELERKRQSRLVCQEERRMSEEST